jgi:hypothetical protein
MGGIVTKRRNADGSSKGGNGGSDSFLSAEDHKGFKAFLHHQPACLSSWDHIVHGAIDGKYLADWFQIYVIDSLRCLPDTEEGRAIESLLTQSARKRGKNPVLFVMRYCVRLHRVGESEVLIPCMISVRQFTNQQCFLLQMKRRLGVLGREHSRIGVSAKMLNQFVECLLYGVSQCVDPLNRDAIMIAWKTNLAYIVGHMTTTTFTFVRNSFSSSNQVSGCCAQCGEYLVGGRADRCEECMEMGSMTAKPSVDRSEAISIIVGSLSELDLNGNENVCYAIKEMVKESENGSE